MPGMGDDSVVKVISRLTFDITLAKQNLRELAKETGVSAKEIKRIAKEIEQSYRELDKANVSEGTRIKQEERMWAQRAQQKERERQAEERRMQAEIRAFEQQEKAQQRVAVQQQKAEERAARDEARRAQAAAKEEARQARAAALEQKAAIAAAARMQKEQEASAIALAQLGAQSALQQANLKMEGLGNLNLKARVVAQSEDVAKLREKIALEGRISDENLKQIQHLKMQGKILDANIREAVSLKMAAPGGMLQNMMGRRLQWFLAGSLFYGFQAGARQVINDVADIETRMVSLARVMDDPAFEMEGARTAIFSLAQEFGFSFGEVQDIVLRWAQAGYDLKDSLEATRASLIALNTAELDAQQATASMVGIMSQWSMSTSQLQGVIDKINKIADNFPTTSQDLVDGLLRASGAARNANMSFEETLGVLTAMQVASGRTGKEVGNALNSIISYIQRAKSLETLQDAGIAVFEDVETQKLRSTFDILKDLSTNWNKMESSGLAQSFMDDAEAAGLFAEEVAVAGGALEEWTDLQRRDILQSGAGVYRRNYLLGLLKNFSQVYEVLQVQESALGYSQRENEKAMSTYTKQVAAFKAELQELGWAVAAEGGPLDALKALVSMLRQGVDWFNKLPQTTKDAITALGLLGLSIGILNAGAKEFMGIGMGAILRDWRGGVSRLTASLKTLTTGLGGVGAATLKLAPLVAAFAGMLYLVNRINDQANELQNTFNNMEGDFDSTIKGLEAEVKLHTENVKLVQDLGDEYRKLEKQRKEMQRMGDMEPEEFALRRREILFELEAALGKEEAAQLKAADVSEEVSQRIIEAEIAKAREASKAIEQHTLAYKRAVRDQIDDTLKTLDALDAQSKGWMNSLTFSERVTVLWGDAVTKVHRTVASSLEWLFRLSESLYSWLSDKLKAFAGNARDFSMLDAAIPGLKQAREWAAGLADSLSVGADKAAEFSRIAKENAGGVAEGLIKGVGGVLGAPFGITPNLLDPEAMAKSADDAIEAARQRLRKHLIDLQEELASFSGGSGGGEDDNNKEFGTDDEESAADRIRSLTDAIVAQTEALGALDDAKERDISLLKEQIAYRTREGASLEELQQADADRLKLMDLLSQRQDVLHQQADAARVAHAALAEAQSHVDRSTEEGAEAYATLGDAMERMLSIAGQNSAEWWRIERKQADLARENNAVSVETIRTLEKAKEAYDDGTLSLEDYKLALGALADQAGLSEEATKALREEQRRIAESEFSDRLEELERLYSDGYLSLEQYIGGLSELEQQGFSTADALAKLREAQSKALREFYSTSLEKEADRIERAYKDATDRIDRQLERSLDRVDRRLKDKIGRWQEELAALEGEQTDIDRDRAGDEHERTIADLREQRRYHELRLGREHEEALQDIDRQIAEENRRWEEQQQDWELSDRREYLQDKIDQAEEAAKEERERLEKKAERQREDLEEHYEKVKEITEGGILDTIAALAATDAQWFDTGKGLIDRLIDGLESGNFDYVLNQINRVRQAAEEAASAATGLTFGGASVSPSSFSGVTSSAVPAYSVGAWEIPQTQFALLHPGETVLPSYAAQAFRNFGPAIANLDRVIEAVGNRVIQALTSLPRETKVYGGENVYLEDEVDLDMLSRAQARQVMRVQRGMG